MPIVIKKATKVPDPVVVPVEPVPTPQVAPSKKLVLPPKAKAPEKPTTSDYPSYGSEVHTLPPSPVVKAIDAQGIECSYCGHVYMAPCNGKRYDCSNRVHIDQGKAA